jgi:hypothetical protein
MTTQRGPFIREELGGAECLTRLAEAPLARVLISVRCLPAALPVFVQMTGRNVLLASTEDAVIEAARRGDVLAVQLDGTDPDGATWSVQVTGASHLGDPRTLPESEAHHRIGDALSDGATLVVVPLTMVSGERIRWSFPK